MDVKLKLFYVGVVLISLVSAFAFMNYLDESKSTQITTQETQEEFERSFKFFVENGPGPSSQEEYNGMALTYIVNREVLVK